MIITIKKIVTVFLSLIILCGCFNGNKNLNIEIEMVEPEIYAKYLTMISNAGKKPDLYYSDEAMLGLKLSRFVQNKWETTYLDQLDTQEHFNPVMGKHFLLHGKIFYLDYQSETRIILKQLTEKEEGGFFADGTRISCSNFCVLQDSFESEPLLFYYDSGILKAAILEEHRYIEELAFDTEKFRDVEEFQVFKTLDYYTMVYSSNGGLFLVRLALNKDEKRIEVESLLQIDSGIEQFHAVLFDDDVTILYYSREYLLSCYRGGTNQKIGYYPEIHFLNVNYHKNQPVFTICTPDKESKNLPVYAVYFIHGDLLGNKKWREDLLVRSDTPFIACGTLDTNDNFYTLLSGNILQLLTISASGL